MNTWNDIEHGFGPARATQYTASDTDQLAAALYKLFHGRYVKSDNGHVITLTDGTHLTIQAATTLPNGRYLLADSLDMDTDNFVNSDDDHYKKWDSEPLIREVDAPGSNERPYMTEAEHYANDCRYDDGDEEPTIAQLGL